MLKTTNKKGFKSDVYGIEIKIETKIDNYDYEELGNYKIQKVI